MPKKRQKTSAIKRLRIRLAYLDGFDSMERVAEEFGVDQSSVSRLLDEFVRPDDGKNLDKHWDRWAREAPKAWELDPEDFYCLVVACRLRRANYLKGVVAAIAAGVVTPGQALGRPVDTDDRPEKVSAPIST